MTDFIQTCATCQQTRLHMNESVTLKPIVRVANAPHATALIGTDFVKFGKVTKNGNIGCYVFINPFTKHCAFFPAKANNAWELCQALYSYCALFGTSLRIISDPGVDYTSAAFAQLTKMLGIHHDVSLVDVHTSNLTESTNAQLVRRFRELNIDDPDMFKQPGSDTHIEWDHPVVLAAVSIVMNEYKSTETGYSAHELTFGPDSNDRFRFLVPGSSEYNANKFIQLYGQSLSAIRGKAHAFQSRILSKRLSLTPRHIQNVYQNTDFVLKKENQPPEKLGAPYSGPYAVIQHVKNDVTVRNLITDAIEIFPVDKLKIFFGTREEAYTAAKRDQDQHEIARFLSHKGDVERRTGMSFETLFVDESVHWLHYSTDIASTTHFETYCRQRHELWPLLYTVAIAKDRAKQFKASQITLFPDLPTTIFVDLRWFGPSAWYENLSLPDCFRSIYVFECVVTTFANPATKKEVRVHFPLIEETHIVNNVWVQTWGRYNSLGDHLTLITAKFAQDHPLILDAKHRTRLVRKFKSMTK